MAERIIDYNNYFLKSYALKFMMKLVLVKRKTNFHSAVMFTKLLLTELKSSIDTTPLLQATDVVDPTRELYLSNELKIRKHH